MSSTAMLMTERPGQTSSTLAPMCREKVTSSLKYRTRWSSCSSLRVPPPSLTGRSLPGSLAVGSLDLGYQGSPEDAPAGEAVRRDQSGALHHQGGIGK